MLQTADLVRQHSGPAVCVQRIASCCSNARAYLLGAHHPPSMDLGNCCHILEWKRGEGPACWRVTHARIIGHQTSRDIHIRLPAARVCVEPCKRTTVHSYIEGGLLDSQLRQSVLGWLVLARALAQVKTAARRAEPFRPRRLVPSERESAEGRRGDLIAPGIRRYSGRYDTIFAKPRLCRRQVSRQAEKA